MKLYTKQEVEDLFYKLEQERDLFYPEDATELVPLEEFLKDNL